MKNMTGYPVNVFSLGKPGFFTLVVFHFPDQLQYSDDT